MHLEGSGRSRRIALLASAVMALVGCDHATKIAAESALRGGRAVTVVPGWVDLRFTENDDIAFNALSRLSLHPPAWLLAALAAVAMVAIAVAWARTRGSALSHSAYALIAAGAIGNAADRLLRGRVIDFIHLRFWPVFNVADVAVVAGVILLLWARSAPRAAPRA